MSDWLLTTLNTYWSLIPITLAQSLILSFVVLGIMIPFRILKFPDLTSEGAYPLGAAVAAVAASSGLDPFSQILCATAAGFLAGCCTALIHLRFRINTLLAGILMVTMLYSVILRIMGKSNLSLFGLPSIFQWVDSGVSPGPEAKILVVGIAVVLIFIALAYFFASEKGLAMRAVGANPDMAEAQGISVWWAVLLGVGAASAMTATGGAIIAQSQGFADVNMGLGILINGLAALMIGEAVVGKKSMGRQLAAPFVGAILYYQLVSLLLAAKMHPPDLKLATGLFVLIMLALPAIKRKEAAREREKIRE